MLSVSVLQIHTFEVPKEKDISGSVLAAVFGNVKGKSAHMKLSYKTAGTKKAPGKKEACFEVQKFNFGNQSDVSQIIASTSHYRMHLAFNHGGESVSFYDYTGISPTHPNKPKPSVSFYFPDLISYAQEKDYLLAEMKVEGENAIRVLKELDPGVWLIYLGRQETFALFNMATNGYVRCTLTGIPPNQIVSAFKLHPGFYMGENESLVFVDCGKVRSVETRLNH